MKNGFKFSIIFSFFLAFIFTGCTNPDVDLENMNAQQFTKVLGNGINLGNTMEATNSWIGYNV